MDDDNEIAGYAGVTGTLAVTAFFLVLRAHPMLGALTMAASFYGLYKTRQAAHRLNAEPVDGNPPSTLNGRLDIYRATGL